MKVRASLYLAVISLLTPLSIASPQRLEVGTYLRISHQCQAANSPSHGERMACRTTRGSLARTTADSVHLSAPTGAVSRDSILRVELRVRRNHRIRGAALGALAGTALGVGVTAIAASKCSGEFCGLVWFIFTVPPGFVLGTLTGVIVGGGEKWRPVALDQLGAGQSRAVPKPFKLGLALAF